MDQKGKDQLDQFMGRNMWRQSESRFSRLAGSKEENGVFIGKKDSFWKTLQFLIRCIESKI